MTACVEFSGVSLSFVGVDVLKDVSFSVEPGELFAIIGPNGAGKTSIFNIISGVYRPQSGEVRIQGRSIAGAQPHQIAAMGVARTFQNLELFDALDAVENVMLGRHRSLRYNVFEAIVWLGRARSEEVANRRRAEEIIDFLEIEQYRSQPVGSLPYGVRKRIELGRALAMNPTVMLLDEPVAGMNAEETEDMARYLIDIRAEFGIAMILVEHDMGLVMDLADRVLAIEFGRPIAQGAPAEIQNNEAVIRAYLGEEQLS